MSNLKLITTETFNNLPCDFYRNMNDDILLTREQIGQALEYSDPIKAIQKIHLKHQDRLEPLCLRIKGHPQFGKGHPQFGGVLTKSEEQERVYYTEKGVMEICRWSRQKNAHIFMDWVWDIVEKYRHNELTPDLSQIMNTLNTTTNAISSLTQVVLAMQEKMESAKEVQTKDQPQPQPETKPQKKKWSYWSTKMFPKYQVLTDYFKISNTELYANLYRELQNTYPEIDLNQEIDDYCCEHGLDSVYTQEVIEHRLHLRRAFEGIVNQILERYGLLDSQPVQVKYKTIFTEKDKQE